jgi:transposase
MLLPGFPAGAIRVGKLVSVLSKDGTVTYFVGSDNYFSHAEGDRKSQRFAISTLIANRHMRLRDLEGSALGIPRRTVQHWLRQLEAKGADSFFVPSRRRGAPVMTAEARARCTSLLAEGMRIPEIARRLKIDESTLRKAVARGDVKRLESIEQFEVREMDAAQTKSERSRQDAQAATGMGTACTRSDERIGAAMGLVRSASTRHETCQDVEMGGVLAGLPALCANGLLSGLGKYLSLPKGYYSALHILITLGFMALARIRRPEGLRHVPPGELGKALGLDRAPEVKTLREKIGLMAEQGAPADWMKDLARTWMAVDPTEAGYLYVDGHVRVYHGSDALLPRRYVSRDKLCLRGTTDYWINNALGSPFFAVSKTVTDGLAATLVDEIVPDLLKMVPGQPSESELAAQPLLHRFVVIFDREGSSYSLLSKLWEKRIGAITYRKAVKDLWPEDEFKDVEVPVPGGGVTTMSLAARESTISAGCASMPVLEVRRLTKTKHQTAIITTARTLKHPVIAGRMFARWCQENFFAYMMEHFDIDGLVQYGCEEIPGATEVVNPAWRKLDRIVGDKRRELRNLRAEIGALSIDDESQSIQVNAERVHDLQQVEADLKELRAQRRATPRKVRIDSLPKEERPQQLLPLTKIFTDTVKMIAYRAETALVGMLRPYLAKEEEARALIRELFVSAADLEPDEETKTLTVRIHRMACPAHDKAADALLTQLTKEAFLHPETGMRMIFTLA